jgi:hypothetical protein
MVLAGVAGLRLLIPTCILSSDRDIMCSRARVSGWSRDPVSECPLESPHPTQYRRSGQHQSHSYLPYYRRRGGPISKHVQVLERATLWSLVQMGQETKMYYSDEESSNPIYRPRSVVNGVKQDYSFNGIYHGFLYTLHENGGHTVA